MLDFVDWSQWTYNELATHLFNLYCIRTYIF